MKRISSDQQYSHIILYEIQDDSQNIDSDCVCTSHYQPDKYVVCTYDDQWYIGNNVEQSDINSDVLVTFIKHSNTKLSWLRQEDNCWVPFQHILCTTDVPQPDSQAAKQIRYLHTTDAAHNETVKYVC